MMDSSTNPAARQEHRRPHALLVLGLVIPVLVAIPLWAFVWAAANLAPRDLPLGVAGQPAAVAPLTQQLATTGGAFDVHTYPSAEAARDAIEHREIYGALVAAPEGLLLLTASAASPAVAQALTQALTTQPGRGPVEVNDVVATAPRDPHGAAFGSSVLPLVIVSVLAGVIVMALSRPGWRQVAALAGAAVVAATVAIAMVQGWLEVLDGNWAVNLAALVLTVFALASTVVGLTAALGRVGLAVAAPLLIFIGNPWSGATSAPELLPQPAGVIGQLLPPGAGSSLLRSTAFFDGAGATPHLLVLAAWSLIGLAGIWWGAHRNRSTVAVLRDAATPVAAAIAR